MATEAKRRRVEGSSLSKILPSLDLTSPSPYVLLDCHILLKKVLINRELVEQFLIHQRHFQQLLNLVCSCSERQALSDDDKTTWQSVTKECLSVLANCCHFSIAACQEIKKSANGVIQHIGKMLVDTQQSDLVKSTALRLLGNMCEHKETAVPIVQTPALLDTICAACQQVSPDVRRNAIRAIRLLVSLSNSFAKVGNIFNAVYFLKAHCGGSQKIGGTLTKK
uniref:Uncharacterized protein n=1 Tax=Plectus sambesii TaxID=2011161 RepID=A0A914UVR6_9BILA